VADSKRRGDDTAAESAELEELLDEEAEESAERGDKADSAVEKAERRSGERKAKDDDRRPGIFGRFVRFVREVAAELRKVIWPTRKELLTYTSVVVVFVVIMLTVVGLLDLGFAKLMLLVFGA
jgi:preprotein translocase subunit SecE